MTKRHSAEIRRELICIGIPLIAIAGAIISLLMAGNAQAMSMLPTGEDKAVPIGMFDSAIRLRKSDNRIQNVDYYLHATNRSGLAGGWMASVEGDRESPVMALSLVEFREVGPLSVWPELDDAMSEKLVEGYSGFIDPVGELKLGIGKTRDSSVGAVDTRRFKKGDRQCLLLSRVVPPETSPDQKHAKAWLCGFYCEPNREYLSDAAIDAFLSSIIIVDRMVSEGR